MTGGERVRGFPAFDPVRRRAGRFARTWWGNAWIKAMQETSLDEGPLRQGRVYACAGRVGPITVSPGRIAAPVYGLHGAAYRTVVLVERLSDAQWGRLLDQVAAEAGHIAALLDRDMPHDLVHAAADAGVRLLPGLGDLEPECDCPGWELPCKHAAALCYQASWLLDQDPFVLLLLRGRGRAELVAELQRRNALHVRPAAEDRPAAARAAGPTAAEAYARGVPPLPDPPPPDPGTPVEGILSALPAAPGVDPAGLRFLAADAAARARELLAGRTPPVLDLWQDTVRLAAAYQDPELTARLRRAVDADEGPQDTGARRTDSGAGGGRTAAELPRAVRAWRYGGPAGLEVLEEAWSPPRGDAKVSGDLARARAVLARAVSDGWGEGPDPAADVRTRRLLNRWTVEGLGLQLRYGRDGRWYPYRQECGAWWPAGPPDRDAAAALGRLLGS